VACYALGDWYHCGGCWLCRLLVAGALMARYIIETGKGELVTECDTETEVRKYLDDNQDPGGGWDARMLIVVDRTNPTICWDYAWRIMRNMNDLAIFC